MSDLATWLLEQIAEDERTARDCRRWADCEDGCPAHTTPVERMLAECEAKRRIVEALTATMAVVDAPTTPGPESRGYRDVAAGLGDAVRFLAVPYADRPGYLEEWRP